ncbi:MAG: hypothetical protein FWG38_00625 [Defluviitaleaceae bacterium]|nr:hypothetical protein [Defluviitaleaceae bacterium]
MDALQAELAAAQAEIAALQDQVVETGTEETLTTDDFEPTYAVVYEDATEIQDEQIAAERPVDGIFRNIPEPTNIVPLTSVAPIIGRGATDGTYYAPISELDILGMVVSPHAVQTFSYPSDDGRATSTILNENRDNPISLENKSVITFTNGGISHNDFRSTHPDSGSVYVIHGVYTLHNLAGEFETLYLRYGVVLGSFYITSIPRKRVRIIGDGEELYNELWTALIPYTTTWRREVPDVAIDVSGVEELKIVVMFEWLHVHGRIFWSDAHGRVDLSNNQMRVLLSIE